MAIFLKLDFDTKILMRSPFLDESSSNLECRLVMRLSKIDVQNFWSRVKFWPKNCIFRSISEKTAAARTRNRNFKMFCTTIFYNDLKMVYTNFWPPRAKNGDRNKLQVKKVVLRYKALLKIRYPMYWDRKCEIELFVISAVVGIFLIGKKRSNLR